MATFEPFRIADDAVDLRDAPQRVLSSRAPTPAIGLGTFGSDQVAPDAVAAAVW